MNKKQIFQYKEYIARIVANKNVLDIGSIGHNFKDRYNRYHFWIFDVLKSNAKFIVGIDCLKNSVIEARKEGYNVVYGDAQNFNLGKKYDIIFAGDIIEHLSNPGLFIDNCRRHLRKDGLIIISTPNTYSFARLFRVLEQWTNNPITNTEHTFYFTPQVLNELFGRYGFSPIQERYFTTNLKYVGLMRIAQVINDSLCFIFGKKFKESLVIIYKINENGS